MPTILSKKYGEKAWKTCQILRFIAIVFEFILIATMLVWLWYPVTVFSWEITSYWWIGVLVGLIIFIPGLILMIIGMKDAGKESHTPSKETEMYGGIYLRIRHPQTLGEMPMFIAIAFMVNSWFLVALMTVYVINYTMIMLHFEEKDLVERFGDSYREYQQEVGMLFPKKKQKKTKGKNQ